MVENLGFQNLIEQLEPRYKLPSRHYLTDQAIPNLHREVGDFLAKLVENVGAISLTTDIWSSDVCPVSL